MRTEYDFDEKTRQYKCDSCGYVYKEDTTKINIYEKTITGDEEFIELGTTDIIKDKGSYENRLEKTKLYACPKCGCVHIEV